MAAEVCLLLMQSLTGKCEANVPQVNPPVPVVEDQTVATAAPVENPTAVAIAPDAASEPQFGKLCEEEQAQRLAVCAIPSKAQAHWVVPRAAGDAVVDDEPPANVSANPQVDVTTPAALNLPATPVVSVPAPSLPQFSGPATTTPTGSTSAIAARRPTSGSQLYWQRRLALQDGRTYTRLPTDAYTSQWSQATQQPTYQDWKALLAQEARAIASGQGQNRLEVVVGDSFGLWLPPELLPRDRLWLNQSISGDTTAGILQRVEAFANTRPTTIHLMAGANDLKNGVPEAQIVQNLHQTVRLLKQQHPQARIVVYSVLPTRRAEIGNERVRSLNTRIAELTQLNDVEYRNVHPWFQDEVGYLRLDLTTDGLHLSPQGYALWQRAILARAL